VARSVLTLRSKAHWLLRTCPTFQELQPVSTGCICVLQCECLGNNKNVGTRSQVSLYCAGNVLTRPCDQASNGQGSTSSAGLQPCLHLTSSISVTSGFGSIYFVFFIDCQHRLTVCRQVCGMDGLELSSSRRCDRLGVLMATSKNSTNLRIMTPCNLALQPSNHIPIPSVLILTQTKKHK
jgi:hypothetical protein